MNASQTERFYQAWGREGEHGEWFSIAAFTARIGESARQAWRRYRNQDSISAYPDRHVQSRTLAIEIDQLS